MKYNIAVLSGDGIGPEVVKQGIKVLKAIEKKYGHEFILTEGIVGAVAIDKVGNPYPDETHALCMKSDAVLFGAIGDPKYDNDPSAKIRPEQGLLAMRKKLNLFANIRPTKIFEKLIEKSNLKADVIKNVDFVVLRELIGGLYFGKPQGISENGKEAFDTCFYDENQIKQIVKLAFEYARNRKKKLCLIDKANVLATSRLWRKITDEIHKDYKDIELNKMFVDNAAMQIILNPSQFDVIVTENMFGDIISDEASVLSGSLGLAPSASIGTHTSVYEPIHGSYPQAAGKNIANPMATILSVAMMFEYSFKLNEISNKIINAVDKTIENGEVTIDLNKEKYLTTEEVGNKITEKI